MTLLCIDVSRWQGSIDFNAAAKAGDVLIFMKATEGVGFVDPMLATYRAQVRAARLTCGFYHFARAGDPIAEAEDFCAAVGALQVGDLVALDWETTAPNPVAWCKAWLDHVWSLLGVKPLIYLNQSERDGYDWTPVVAGDYGLWLAAYDGTLNVPASGRWPAVALKQYTSGGRVPGVAGAVDQDVFYGDAAALARYGKQGTDMPLTDADKQWIAAQLRPIYDTLTPGVVGVKFDGDLYAKITSTAAAVGKPAVVSVDADAVATALEGNTSFLAALAKAVNDDAAARLKS